MSDLSSNDVDWTALTQRAEEIRALAYVPYSRFSVGAAAIADDGRVVVGCNVENASYGVTLCAECGLVSALAASGGGRLVAFACVAGHVDAGPEPVMPCGRCRQLLYEHGGAQLLLATPSGVRTLAQVLPDAFGPESLPGG